MSQRQRKTIYWQDAPMPRSQRVLAINLGIANLAELCIDGTRLLASANRRKTWTSTRLARRLPKAIAGLKQRREQLATLQQTTADRAYTTGENNPAFASDEASDCYYCPAGKALPHRTTINTTYRLRRSATK